MDETIGVTGSQSLDPMHDLRRMLPIINALPRTCTLVTGANIGVESFVAAMAHDQGLKVHTVVPADQSHVDRFWRKHCTTFEEMPPGTTERDQSERIVALSDLLVAFPEHAEDDPRSEDSGTWTIVRIARHAAKQVEVHVLRRSAADA